MELKDLSDILQNTYTKTYRMQATGKGGETIRTSVPRAVVAREAKRRGMLVKEFIKKFRVEWSFNGFAGAYAQFVPKEVTEEKENEVII